MIKISVAELEAALKLLKTTSNEMHVSLLTEGDQLSITFLNSSGELVSIKLFSEASAIMPKVTTTENLLHLITRLNRKG